MIERDPMCSDITAAISKVCDLPDREEKWALLKTLNEVLTLAAYPPMISIPTDRPINPGIGML